jgi:hypothetical protein
MEMILDHELSTLNLQEQVTALKASNAKLRGVLSSAKKFIATGRCVYGKALLIAVINAAVSSDL